MTFRTLAPFLATFLLCCAGTLSAEWSDNFNGTYQESWTWRSVSSLGPGPGKNSLVNDTLQLQDTTPIASGGAASAFGLVAEKPFSNVRVSATLNPGGDNNMFDDVGLLARMNPSNLTGYALTVDFGGSLDLRIINANQQTVELERVDFELNLTDSVHLVLTLNDEVGILG